MWNLLHEIIQTPLGAFGLLIVVLTLICATCSGVCSIARMMLNYRLLATGKQTLPEEPVVDNSSLED